MQESVHDYAFSPSARRCESSLSVSRPINLHSEGQISKTSIIEQNPLLGAGGKLKCQLDCLTFNCDIKEASEMLRYLLQEGFCFYTRIINAA